MACRTVSLQCWLMLWSARFGAWKATDKPRAAGTAIFRLASARELLEVGNFSTEKTVPAAFENVEQMCRASAKYGFG